MFSMARRFGEHAPRRMTRVTDTFLDLVRALGRATLADCDPECSIVQHRRDAAAVLGAIRQNPELAQRIAVWAVGPDGTEGN